MEKMAKIILQWLESVVDSEEQRELYYYGILEGLQILLNVITMLVVGAWTGRIVQCVCFYLAYTVLRVYAGGYHADTRIRCYIFSSGMLLLFLLTLDWSMSCTVWPLIAAGVSEIMIVWLAPVQNPNHLLDEKEHNLFRHITLVLSAGYMLLLIVAFWQRWNVVMGSMVETLGWVAVMLVVGKVKYRKL